MEQRGEMMKSEAHVGHRRAKLARLFWLALGPALGIAALLILPDVFAVLSRPVRRELIEGILNALQVGYVALLAVCLPGAALVAWAGFRARRRGQGRPLLARLFLLCGSCIMGLIGLELAAFAWLAWADRMPVLSERLADRPRPDLVHPRLASSRSETESDLPDRFASAAADTVHFVVIGESSAQGYPYYPRLSIGDIVVWQLQRAVAERRFDVAVLAKGGADLQMMHHKLASLDRRPDAMIIYVGHNEFQARYAWARTMRPRPGPGEPLEPFADRFSRFSPFFRMIGKAIDTNRLDAPAPLYPREVLDWPMCTPSEYAEILRDFRGRLEAIVAYCERLGTLPILVIPPANEGGFEPSRSTLPETVSDFERQALTREFRSARAAEVEPARAISQYRSLVARQPGFAEAQFRLARLLEHSGDWDEARLCYTRARDADAIPLRCPTPFQDAYRAVAARHDCILIDGPEVLRAISPHGILDDTLFHDAHHPTLRGHIALAEAVLRALHARHAFGWRAGPDPVIEPLDCAEHFGVKPNDWFLVCERSSEFYRYSSITRYDPTERLAKARRYGLAAEKIAEGVPPEETGVPGVGCRVKNRD